MKSATNNEKASQHARFRSHFSSIYARTVLFSWMVGIMTISIFLIYIIPQQDRALLNALDSKASALNTSIHNITSVSIAAGDNNEVVRQCMNIIKNDKQINYIVLAENVGSALICTRAGWKEERNSDVWQRIPKGYESHGNIISSNLADSDVFQHSDLFDLSKGKLGWIHVGLSLDEYHTGLSAIISRTIHVSIIGALFGLLVSIRHARQLVKPILILETTANRLSQGDLSAQAKVNRNDEIGDLAASINRMAQSIHDREVFVRSQNKNLAKLVTERALQTGKLLEAAKRICETSADTFGTGSVSVWLFSEDKKTLECLNKFNQSKGTHSQKESISREGNEAYFDALSRMRVLAATDVVNDPRTSCLTESYLRPMKTVSMINAVIRIDGNVEGVVCHELAGEMHAWTLDEENFAGSIADLMALALNASKRRAMHDALVTAKEAVEVASEAKSRFFANVSHEIRTPLNGAVGMLKLLRESPLNDNQKRFVDRGILSSDALLSVINDVLDYSKMEAGKLEIETLEFDLVDVVENVVNMFAHIAEEKGLELVCDIDHAVPGIVHGDPNRIGQVLINLVSNAVKFTDRQGDVIVRVHLEDETSDSARIRFEVEDTGEGVSIKEQDRIFEPFQQESSSTTRRFGGSGLGLGICRQLVELMEGKIQMTSRIGFGSTFCFSIPLGRHKGMAGDEVGTGRSESLRDLDIIVADDHQANRQMISSALESWGYRVSEAGDGSSALALMQARAAAGHVFDLALIDWNMPGMNGEELGRQIKADPQLSKTGLIMLCTATETDECCLKKPCIGGCLPKPVRQSELYDAIVNAINPTHGQMDETIADVPRLPAPAHNAEVRILLAEDNEINQEVVREILGNFGYSCDVATTGHEAVKVVADGEYDLVFMDCMMPGMDGYEASRCIRDHEKGTGRQVPIVALTANAMKGDRERCLAAGMNDYLSKPLDPALMMEVVAKWCAKPVAPEKPALEDGSEDDAKPVFDRGAVLKRCMGNEILLEKLVAKFLVQVDEDVGLMEEALSVPDMEETRRIAHRIKGSSANLAMERLNAITAAIEQNARAGNPDQAAIDFRNLNKEIAHIHKHLNTKQAA